MADEQKRDQKFEWWQQVIQPDADRKTVVEIYDNWAETYEKVLCLHFTRRNFNLGSAVFCAVLNCCSLSLMLDLLAARSR